MKLVFLRFHFASSGEEVYVKASDIIAFYRTDDNDTESKSATHLKVADGRFLLRESVEEVIEIIMRMNDVQERNS